MASDFEFRPLILWHLLSMDAPTVALCWTVLIAWITRTRLSGASEAAMWLAVWTLYAADRLMDARGLGGDRRMELKGLESRHLFHHRHRRLFQVAIAVSLVCLGFLLRMLPPESIRLYAIEGVFMAGYFVLIHWGRDEDSLRGRRGRRLPKELLVGPFFAAAVFIPTVSRRPELRWELLPLAILFAGLCSLNCLYIFAWEHPKADRAPFGTAWALGRVNGLCWFFVGLSLAICLPFGDLGWSPGSFRLYGFACALSGLMLFGFDRLGRRMSKTALRVAADVCLLTPLLVFPFLRNLGRV